MLHTPITFRSQTINNMPITNADYWLFLRGRIKRGKEGILFLEQYTFISRPFCPCEWGEMAKKTKPTVFLLASPYQIDHYKKFLLYILGYRKIIASFSQDTMMHISEWTNITKQWHEITECGPGGWDLSTTRISE